MHLWIIRSDIDLRQVASVSDRKIRPERRLMPGPTQASTVQGA